MTKTIAEQLQEQLNSQSNLGDTTMTTEQKKNQFLETIIEKDPQELTMEQDMELRRIANERVNYKNNVIMDMEATTMTQSKDHMEVIEVPKDINNTQFTMEFTTKEQAMPGVNTTMNEQELIAGIKPIATATVSNGKATNGTKSNATQRNNKETRNMNTQSRPSYMDELATAIATDPINMGTIRDILMYGPNDGASMKMKDILVLKSNTRRDAFLVECARMYSMNFNLDNGSKNPARIQLYMKLFGYDTDREGNPKVNNSMYNILKNEVASEVPTMTKIENGIIAGTTLFGKIMGAVIGSGVAAFGGAIAVGTRSAMMSSIEIEKAYLESKCMKELNPELQQLREINANIKAAKDMAKTANNTPKE